MPIDIQRLRDKRRRAHYSDQFARLRYGLVGRIVGTSYEIDVAGKPNWVWVRILRGDVVVGDLETINVGVARIPNTPVRIDDNEDGNPEIRGLNPKEAEAFLGTNAPNLGVAPHTHEIGFGLDDPVAARRIKPGLVYRRSTDPGLTVYIAPFNYKTAAGADALWPGGTIALTAPATSGKKYWVKVGVNPTTGAAVATTGTEYPLTTPLTATELAAIAFTGYIPLAGVQLRNGQTTIDDEAAFLDCSLLRAGGSVGGSAGYYQTIQNNGSAMTQRPTLNLIQGEGIQLDIADSSGFNRTNVSITNVVSYVGTAGENVSANEAVYLNAADNKWYKIDIDAVAAVKVAKFRGFAAAAAVTDGIISTRLFGKMGNFSSLTGGLDVYASTTAGGITHTKPTVSAGGGQRAIIRLGFAIDTASIFILPSPVEFLKRESLSNGSSLTIEHYSDPLGRERRARAYISTTTGGTLTENTSANHDQGVPLRGGTGSGATNTVTSSTADGQPVGDSGGTDYLWAQSFQVTAGTLTGFTFALRANGGTPTGTMTWEICSNSGSDPGTVLETGTLTPTPSATNTVACPAGVFLAASTTYWLKLYSTANQSSGNNWSWYASTTDVYGSGTASVSTNGGSSWTPQSIDMNCAIITAATAPFDRIAQSFQIGSSGDCDYATLYLRKFGSPAGTMTLRIETNSGSAPSGTLVDASATITVAESGLSTSYSNVTFNFTDFALVSGTTYWLVLSTDRSASDTNYVVWGVDASTPGYASGNLSTYASAAYTADTGKDAIFSVVGPTTTYEEPCVVGRESGGTRDVSVRYDDGAGANADTKTTFTNRIGSTADITAVLELM